MRILAIRGENLASLGKPFEVDFESEPLAGTGLFAITGETGSGKSTILDALCLALYGLYPRFSENQQLDALPDPSGAKLSIMDGGTILRRGTSNGHAEVEFIGQDGQRYRARWEARRAHKKPNGAIQPAQRSLKRIEGATIHSVANSKIEVQKAIDSQTGLSFEQFCRTVLLPQGQFDAFLMAQKAERGALLEKLTGTEIYGRISKIVFEKARILRREAEQLETRLTDLGVLPTEERAAIQQSIEDLEKNVAAKTVEQNVLRDLISRIDNLEQAYSRLTEAEQTLESARSNSALAAHDRARLESFLMAEPLRSLCDRVTDLGRRQGLCEEEITGAQDALKQAIENDEQAKAKVLTAKTAYEEAEQNFKTFGPIWDQAARLDSECTTAESEANIARVAEADARRSLTESDDDLAMTSRKLREAGAELQTSKEELEKRSKFIQLAEQISSVETLLGRYEEGVDTATDLRRQTDEGQQTAEEFRRNLAAFTAEVESESMTQKTTSNMALELHHKLDGTEESKWQTEESTLAALLRQARDLELLAERNQQSALDLEEAQIARRNAIDAIKEASSRIAAAEAAQLEQERRRTEIQHNSELAEASLEERSAHLRSLLVKEEPCPICGATEHPYTTTSPDDFLSKLAENLSKERSAIDEQLTQINRDIQDATKDRTASEVLSRNAERDQNRGTKEIQAFQGQFATCHSEMKSTCTDFGFIALLPEALSNDDSASSSATQLRVAIESRQTVANENLSAIKALRRQLDNVSRESQQAQIRLNAVTKKRDEESNRLNQVQVKHAKTTEGLAQAESRLGEIEQDLSQFIAIANISLDRLRENPPACLAALKSLAQEVIDFRARQNEWTGRVSELSDKHKDQSSIRGNLATRAQEAAENLKRRDDAHRSASEGRARLLDGEDTNVHRTRINDNRLLTSRELQHAKEDDTRYTAKRAATQQRERSAVETLATLQDEIARALAAYSERCSSLGIERAIADELLAIPAAQTDTLKMQIEAIDRAIHDAEHLANERRSVVQNLSSVEPKMSDRATLDATLNQITDEINSSREVMGDQKGRLHQDDQLRRTADDLRSEADQKAIVLAVWQQVEDAIGSANGDRFRTFAQSITLEQLVQIANEHLASFSGRYQLARSADTELALHVIDSDMGDEHRSVRSLSGGERFLVSLSLALSLAGLEGHDFTVNTLFIDEGFGALDADTLDVAITALETLHGRGRKVGVITHVAAMIDNISVQVKVEKLGAGSSVVRLQSAGSAM